MTYWDDNPAQEPGCYGREQAEHLGGYILGGDPGCWAPEAWERLLAITGAQSVIDVGCGEGHFLDWLDRYTKSGAIGLGVEGGAHAATVVREKGCNVTVHDYNLGEFKPMPRDLAWCCEFVEHVEARYMPNFLATFRNCRFVALTHAPPNEPGYHHVNCQTPDYWIGAMAAIGFVLLADESRELRDAIPSTHGQWVKRTLMLFKRNDP